MSLSKILNVDFSNTNPWHKSKKDITVTVDILLPEFKKCLIKAVLSTAEARSAKKVGNNSDIVVYEESTYTDATKRIFSIQRKLLCVGENRVVVSVVDEDDPHDASSYEETITVEDRDTFSIKRTFKNSSEYIITGELDMDNVGSLHTNANGMESGVAIPKNHIEMDGRCSIKTVSIDGDNDESKKTLLEQDYSYVQDHYDYVVYKYPIGKYMEYESIDDITLIDRRSE